MNNYLHFKRKCVFKNRTFLAFALFIGGVLLSTAQAQGITVSGTVTASSDGQPLPGVTIVDTNDPSTGTVTDFDGNYSISGIDATTSLQFSYVGFKTVEVPVNNQTTINLAMDEDLASLDEVVVVGYGTQKRGTITGAVGAVKGKELTKSPAVNLTNTLAGRVSGLFVTQSSAEPGFDNATIKIRGTNTYNNSGALVVIDGIPDRAGGLARINPADIEDISVLKDASAAIYGARAANGVILVTTKRGKTGKPQFTYTFNQGWARPTKIPELANAAQYAELRNELEVYQLPVSEWSDANAAFNSTGTYIRPDSSTRNAPYSPEDIALFKSGQDPWGHPDTDWFDETFKTAASQEKHNFQLTGGNENVKYFTSLGYLNQDGYYKNSATGYEQWDIRMNLDAKISENIKLNIGVLGREEFRHFPTESAGAIFRMLTRGRPTEPAYWPNGLPGPDIENGQQPVVITTNATGYDNSKRDFFQSNATLDINIPWIEGLSIKSTAAIDKDFENRKIWRIPWYLYTWDGTSRDSGGTPILVEGQRGPTDPRLTQIASNKLNILLGTNVTYERTFGDHSLLVLAGVNKETVQFEGFSAFKRNFLSTALDNLFAGGEEGQSNTGGAEKAARLNYFGRVTYDFKEKYLLEFLWRYDGSYAFPEATRYGFFPGFSAGWVVSKEGFFEKNVPFINFLKFRGSWGQLGNDKFNNADFPANQFLAAYGFGSYIINNAEVATLGESTVPNPNITWEIATNINVGMETRLLDSKLRLEFDYFANKREDILTQPSASLPNFTGINPPRQNIGEVENKGFDFTLGYNDTIGDEFTYGITFTGGYAKNKIIFNDEAEGAPEWQRQTGHSIGSNLVYGYDGVFATQADIDAETLDYSALVNELRPGDMKYLDYDGDGRITPDDRFRTDRNSDPRFQGGLNLTAGYKGFDFSLFFQGAAGGEVFLGFGEAGTIGNYPLIMYNNRWTVDNPSSVHPRITDRGDQYYSFGNTYWRQDTDYIRLKNIELGYSLPSEVINLLGIQTLRFYVSGSNILTFSDAIFDPEGTSASGRDYPNSAIINTGFTLTF